LKSKVKSAKSKHLILTSVGVTKAIAKNVQRYFKVPTETKAKYHFFGVVVASIALGIGLIVGGWQIYKAVFALTETTKTMPADIQFNRGLVGSLASYLDDEGKIEVATDSIKLAKVGNWWNESYKYRKQITLKNLSSVSISTSSAQITVDTKALVDAGKLLANCNDLRVAKQASSGASMVEQPRSFTPASGTVNCSDSTATIIAFPLTETFASNATSSAYFLYYGNASATTPSYPKEKYLSFDGNSDYVDIPDYVPNSDNFTVAAWFKLDSSVASSATPQSILGNYQWTPFLGYVPNSKTFQHLRQYAGGSESKSWTTSQQLASSQWHHVALVINQTTYIATLYLDGISLGDQAIGTQGYTAGNGSLSKIGDAYSTTFYTGQIDEVKVYRSALNSSAISVIENESGIESSSSMN
jgi:hypothetical protein